MSSEASLNRIELDQLIESDRPVCYGVLKPGPFVQGGIPLVRIVDMDATQVATDGLFRISIALDKEFARSRLTGGELLLSIQGTVGKVAAFPRGFGPANISRTIARLAFTDPADAPLLRHWFQSNEGQRAIDTAIVGSTRSSLNIGVLRRLLVPCIGGAEKDRIIEILDNLDTAIHETEAIIAKLKAVKQGLLHDLLTRGIDANGELRPPQAEAPHLYKQSALGWIPKAWNVEKLESVSSSITSGSRDWARFYADTGALFVRIGNLTREHINFRFESSIRVRPPRKSDGQRTRLEPGDILISITADLGIVGVVPSGLGEAYINQHIALVRPRPFDVNPRFLGHYLAGHGMQRYISQLNDAGAKAGLNLPTIRELPAVRPERQEQDLIAEQLDELDSRIQNTTVEMAKLHELKAGLMDDLLTGRVRVTPLLEPTTP